TARAELGRLIPLAPDAVLAREARFRRALVIAEQGDPNTAVQLLEEIDHTGDDDIDEWSSQARLHITMIHEEHGSMPEAADHYVDTITRYPDSAAALRAYRRILDHFGDDADAAIVWLSESYPGLADSDLGDRTVREIAGRFEATERWAMAWLVWRELVLRYPYS